MPAVHFEDFDACAESLRDWDLEAFQLDRGPFRAELEQVESAGILITEAAFSRRLHQTGEPPRGMRTVVVPAGSSQRIWWRNHRVSGDQIMLFPRGCALDSVSHPDFHVFTVSFPEELASEHGWALGGRDYEGFLAGREVLSGSPGRTRAFRLAAKRFMASSTDSGADLLEALFEALDDPGEPSGLQPGLQPGRERDLALRRSLELIEARERESLSVGDLCRVSGASRRTLEYAYRERFEVSPKTYMMVRRLAGVRRDLRRAGPGTTVTRAANGWGFHHMSQFAALYKRQFGERPSETMCLRG